MTIDCDNAAFRDGSTDSPDPGPELARILRRVATVCEGLNPDGDTVVVRDLNGNKVGKAVLTK
jgi:hypothetical protein